jgi:hypothetical protein
MKKLLGILALGLLLSGCAGRYSLFMESFSTGVVIQNISIFLYKAFQQFENYLFYDFQLQR